MIAHYTLPVFVHNVEKLPVFLLRRDWFGSKAGKGKRKSVGDRTKSRGYQILLLGVAGKVRYDLGNVGGVYSCKLASIILKSYIVVTCARRSPQFGPGRIAEGTLKRGRDVFKCRQQ